MGAAVEGGSGGGPDGSPGILVCADVDVADGACVALLSVCDAPPIPCVCVGLFKCMCIGDTTFVGDAQVSISVPKPTIE